jgi:hypothetical protein
MADKKQFGVRLPSDSAEAVEEYVEERDITQADALRRAIDEFFVEDDSGGGSQSTAIPSSVEWFLAILAAVLVGGGILLTADGTTGGFATFTLGSTLFVSHRKLASVGSAVKAGIQDLENVQPGAVRYLYACILADHPVSWEPRTRVERVARWDLYGIVGMLLAGVLAGLIALPVEIFGAETVIDAVGFNVTLAFLTLFVGLLWASMIGMIAASIAQITVATTGDELPDNTEEPASS